MIMWRLLIALIGLSITGVNLPAQSERTARKTPQAEGLAWHCPPSEIDEPEPTKADLDKHAGYLGPSGVVRFQLIQGRISLDAPQHRKGSQSSDVNGVYESVDVTAKRGIPSVHYILRTNRQHLDLSVQDADLMRIESWMAKQGDQDGQEHHCLLIQPESGPITLSCNSRNQLHQWSGPTLIHVRGLQPRLFDEHFGSLITRMLHGQSLKELSDKTLVATLAELKSPVCVTEVEMNRWIEALGGDQRKLRINAQQKFLDAGTLIVSELQRRLDTSSDRGDLDVEQIARINHILKQLRSRSPDRPRSLAKLLVNDPSYWSMLRGRMSTEQWQLVASREQDFRQHSTSQQTVVRFARHRESRVK